MEIYMYCSLSLNTTNKFSRQMMNEMRWKMLGYTNVISSHTIDFSSSVWWLSDDCLMTVWWLSEDCLMTAWWLPGDCLMTAWWLPDDCLMTLKKIKKWCPTLKIVEHVFKEFSCSILIPIEGVNFLKSQYIYFKIVSS